MKKVLLFFVCALLFSCQSKEAKIDELIKKEMFRTLYDFESYEPIETSKIDSVFTTIYTDSVVKEQAIIIVATMEICEEYVEEIEDHYRTIEIWEDSYSSTGRRKVNNALDKLKEIGEKLEKGLNLVKEAKGVIKERNKNFESSFIGWSVTHKFRCKNKGGNFDLGTYKYVFDPELEKILYTIDEDDDKDKEINSIIKEIIESQENEKEEKEKTENLES